MDKICQQCGSQFKIKQEDLDFLERVSPEFKGKKYLIPPPTCCPDCRQQRRLAFRNERKLYHRKCDLTGKSIISIFSSDSPYTIYEHNEWWGDKWDGKDYGKDFDFEKSFFEQFKELQLKVPRPPLVNNKAENSPYCNFADANKNCHMITTSNYNENSCYSLLLLRSRDVMDAIWCSHCELIYECTDCRNCYNLKFSQNCENCSDSSYLRDCRGVRDSLMCMNLVNKQYHIFNKPHSKEEYNRKKEEIFANLPNYLNEYQKFLKDENINRAGYVFNSEECTGNYIYNSKNISLGFDIYESQDLRYAHDGVEGKDSMDICFFDGAELCYESTSLIGYGYFFTTFCRDSYNLIYCDNCHSCKNCFACTGLRNAEYCILNKQYTKEEYEELVPRIIEHMEGGDPAERGSGSSDSPCGLVSNSTEFGEFFPISSSPFAYNETLAQEFFPLNREEVLENRWKWVDKVDKDRYRGPDYQIPEKIEDVDDDICEKILLCEVSGKPYKIIPFELELYRKMDLPIPKKCPDQRYKDRMALRNPRKLWDRECNRCHRSIKTTYAPERPEKVCCEQCYVNLFN